MLAQSQRYKNRTLLSVDFAGNVEAIQSKDDKTVLICLKKFLRIFG